MHCCTTVCSQVGFGHLLGVEFADAAGSGEGVEAEVATTSVRRRFARSSPIVP